MPINPNIPSSEEVRHLIAERPEFRSASIFGRYLRVNSTTAASYLRAAGIMPANLQEAALIRYGKPHVRLPSPDELRQLIEERPYYRSAARLGKHLHVTGQAAKRYLRKAGILPMNYNEAQLARFNKSNVKVPTPDELRRLVREHPDYRSPTKLAAFLGVTDVTAGHYLRGIGIVTGTSEVALSDRRAVNSHDYANSLIEKYEAAKVKIESALDMLKGLPDAEPVLASERARNKYLDKTAKVQAYRDNFRSVMEGHDLGLGTQLSAERYIEQEFPNLYRQMSVPVQPRNHEKESTYHVGPDGTVYHGMTPDNARDITQSFLDRIGRG